MPSLRLKKQWCGYIEEEEHGTLTKRCRQICGGLVKMMRDPDAWCGPLGLIREDSAEYFAE